MITIHYLIGAIAFALGTLFPFSAHAGNNPAPADEAKLQLVIVKLMYADDLGPYEIQEMKALPPESIQLMVRMLHDTTREHEKLMLIAFLGWKLELDGAADSAVTKKAVVEAIVDKCDHHAANLEEMRRMLAACYGLKDPQIDQLVARLKGSSDPKAREIGEEATEERKTHKSYAP